MTTRFCIIFCAIVGFFTNCAPPPKPLTEAEVAMAWADMTLFITQHTPANTPTYSSRCLGYIGLTMYESIVAGDSAYQSLAGQLNGLDSLPRLDLSKKYNWPIALNAGQSQILRTIYNQTSDVNKRKIDSLEVLILSQFSVKIDSATIRRSMQYGRAVSDQIFAWSKTDGGHRAYLKNFDKTLRFKSKPGCWNPPLYAQSFSHFPLHPHWGKNRTFLRQDAAIAVPEFIEFDTVKTSAYYQQFRQVYDRRKVLTQAEKEVAIWWSDDPDETATPPGHSYQLATIAVRKTRPSLIRCAETYARTGMAVADAFVDCWKWKYLFFSERPNNFITQHIDNQWESFWPDPPFPAFPSGHAIQAAAAATVLTDLYGDRFVFTDSTHVGRKRDEQRNTEFRARHFTSFWAVAEETANSRFYGGIHTPQDNRVGLEKGREIGRNINQLQWRKNYQLR